MTVGKAFSISLMIVSTLFSLIVVADHDPFTVLCYPHAIQIEPGRGRIDYYLKTDGSEQRISYAKCEQAERVIAQARKNLQQVNVSGDGWVTLSSSKILFSWQQFVLENLSLMKHKIRHPRLEIKKPNTDSPLWSYKFPHSSRSFKKQFELCFRELEYQHFDRKDIAIEINRSVITNPRYHKGEFECHQLLRLARSGQEAISQNIAKLSGRSKKNGCR